MIILWFATQAQSVDFGEAAECSLAPFIRGECLEDCQYCFVIVHGMVLCGIVDEEILTALGHLPEYPTCSKAMCWRGIRCTVNFAWPVEPSLQYSSTPCSGLLFLCN